MNIREIINLLEANILEMRIPNPNYDPPYLDVVKNPNSSSLMRMIETSGGDMVRGVVLPDGCYFWHGDGAIHFQVERALGYEGVYPRVVIMIYYEDGEYDKPITDLELFVEPKTLLQIALEDCNFRRSISGLPIKIYNQ